MTKNFLQNIMGDFLSEGTSSRNMDLFGHRLIRESSELPIKIQEDEWTILQNPNRLMRVFKFENDFLMSKFIVKILKYQMRVDHHGSILIEADEVKVEIYNHEMQDITSADLKYADSLDEFYDETVAVTELDEGAL